MDVLRKKYKMEIQKGYTGNGQTSLSIRFLKYWEMAWERIR